MAARAGSFLDLWFFSLQEAVEKISTCDNPMAQILAPDSLSPNQTEEVSPVGK